MDYEKLIDEVEGGIDWSTWDETPTKRVLEDRMIAVRQLATLKEREALVLRREQEQLNQILLAM
jgi:hypothetical protein